MLTMRTSPRVLKATEKYIASIGRKREELTEEQWNLIVTYVRNRRLAIPFLVFLGLVCIFFTIMYYHLGQGYAKNILPPQVVAISFEEQGKTISLLPEEVRRRLNCATECYLLAGMQFMLSIFMLIFIIGSITLVRIQNRRTHRILLSRPTSTESVV